MSVLDRTTDYSGSRWRGKVVNVMDPKKQGRVQVRVIAMHDNESLIPDSELPWALVRMPIGMGASVRGVSASPVGVIPGTMVDGYFADSDRTILVVTGTLLSAGRTKKGQTVDGSYALDSDYNDLVNAARGQDLNAALGLKNLPAVSQIGAVFPAVSAGIGSLSTHSGNILSLMSEADPYNMSGSMASSVTGFAKSYAMNQLISTASSYAGGLTGILGGLSQVQSLMSQGMSEATAIAAMPTQLQTLISSVPGGLSQLMLLANSLSGNPTTLLGSTIGGLMTQAIGLSSMISSSFSSAVNSALSSLGVAKKQREFAIEAAAPTPPPTPEKPKTTTTKASTKPAGSSDPWAQTETYDALPVVININQLEENLNPVTSEEILGKTVDTSTIDSAVENENILKQIGNNADTQAEASKDVRAMNEGRLSAKERAALARAAKNGS